MKVKIERWTVYIDGLYHGEYIDENAAQVVARHLQKERPNQVIDVVYDSWYEYI